MKVRRSAAASEDIDRIWLHVAQVSPAAADQLVDRIVAATAPLSDFPDMGSLRPELGPGIRVVMRLFDDDLVAKTRTAFEVEAFSTSALAAPALAVAALDSSIQNSFEVGARLRTIKLQVPLRSQSESWKEANVKLASEHRAQVMNYLKATSYQLGILYNFGHYPLLEIIRIPNLKDRKPA